jgi:hypothetical protein
MISARILAAARISTDSRDLSFFDLDDETQ